MMDKIKKILSKMNGNVDRIIEKNRLIAARNRLKACLVMQQKRLEQSYAEFGKECYMRGVGIDDESLMTIRDRIMEEQRKFDAFSGRLESLQPTVCKNKNIIHINIPVIKKDR